MKFSDPQTCPFWRTHCRHCIGEIGTLEVMFLDGNCERCSEKLIAEARECITNPDGPAPVYRGDWWGAVHLYRREIPHASPPSWHERD
jgi:hypothetical protein